MLLRPTAVNSVLAEVRALQAQGRQVVSLMRGEPDFPTPDPIKQAAIEAIQRGRTQYPDNRGELALRQAIAARHGYDAATEVLVTTGATLGLYCAFAALLEPGDEVLLPDPVYDAYHSAIRLAGGVPVSVASEVVNGRFVLGDLTKVITPRSRVLLLNTPWNPTGTVFTEAELRSVAAAVAQYNLTVVSDEIYDHLTFGSARHVSPATILRGRTILIQSLSKTYAMTGWRCGYCCGPEQIIQKMFLVLQQVSRGPAPFIQDAAVAALAGPQDCVDEMRREYTRRLGLVREALGARVMMPEGGFFAMIDVRDHGESNEVRRRLLEEHGVVVMHGSAYGPSGEGTLRVSFSAAQPLAEGLARLERGLR
jgi:aspartate/methionine/tyrosine aminotransferase